MGGDQGHKKIPWVKWDVICLPKEDEGLGVKDISKFNPVVGQNTNVKIWRLVRS